MPWYRSGTVSITAGQTTVTGTSTDFAMNARVGDAFQGPDGRWYEVANIASSTVLSILPAYQGPTVADGTYGLAPMQGYVKESADRLRQIVEQYGTILADFGASVRESVLTGLSLLDAGPVSATDSLIVAFGKLQAQASNPANSNLLLNSNFAVNQRAFAGGALSAGAYGHDRWGAYVGGASYTVSAAGVITIASGVICQPVEVSGFNGKTVTMSVEAPSAALTVTIGDGSGSSSASGSITAGAGRRSVTLTVPAAVTGALQLRLGGTNVSFSKPKLEVGARATSWQEPLPGQSLQECMRYYYRYFNGAPDLRTFGSGTTNVNGLLAARSQRLWPVVLRAAPAVTMGSASAYDGSTVIPISGIQNAYHTRWGFEADLLLASATGQYRPLTLLMASGAAVTADAELPCNV